MDEHGCLYGPGDAKGFPVYNGAVHTDEVSCGLVVLVKVEASKMFL